MQPPPLVGEGGCYNTLFVYFTLHLKLLYVKTRNVEYRFGASGVLRFPLDGDGLALSGQEVEVVVGILHGQNLLAVFSTEVQAKHQGGGVACVGDDEVHRGLEHQSYIHLGNGHGVEFLGGLVAPQEVGVGGEEFAIEHGHGFLTELERLGGIRRKDLEAVHGRVGRQVC